ncbi:adenylate cyclase [Scytonema hofmannii PCC 7110]|uniref:Adenylate cyclase n=1 Tax=Scytonema hofmannii PCC 7110 TaxID=128403 RepID=A0A139XCW6_9CYAN|nr:TOMM precursor leader peptide-binding protein [Scytonema hofmannii]KYC42525.1 adenylate cyclase [Scytonema hofmannii PCC 7110]
MFKKPKFKTCFRIETVETEGVFLVSERDTIVVQDRLYLLLCPLLDGNRTVDEIVQQLQDKLPMSYIYYALMELEQRGYLVEYEEVLPSNVAIFCEHLKVNIEDACQRLQVSKVAVRALGDLSGAELIATLESLKIQVAKEGDIEVVLTDDYLRAELVEINQKNLARSRPWMLVKPIGTVIWIGPIFHPEKTGCWECLSQRLQGNRPVEGFIQRRNNVLSSLTPPLADLPSTRQTAITMAATQILQWIVKAENKRLEGILVTHDTLTLETRSHLLIKRPQCYSCGILKQQHLRPLPLILGNRKKTFTADGGHRCVSPEATFEKYRYHISPITGVVRDLGKLSFDLKGLTHTYFAKHHFASMFDDLSVLERNIGGRSAGKGRTDAQARASGFCEAIERYSGVFQGDEIRVKSSYQNLDNKAIHPNTCMNFSQAQYDERLVWNADCGSFFQRVPEPFDEEREIEWTPVWSLTDQDFKYLPTAYCYFGYPISSKPDCWADTNGCAAGNTLEEAIVQGFMELVERDSVALWWYNRIQRAAVDLESFDEPYFQALRCYYQSIDRELWVLDITSDLNIPAFAAISYKSKCQVKDIILGFGAHFDPKLAVQRALTEMNQILPAVLTADANGITQYATSAEAPVLDWWKTATLENQPYLIPDKSAVLKKYFDYPYIATDNFLDDIKLCQQIVEQRGMEMLVLDQTRPDIGLKVVKVIIPGMRHFWKRLAPGRLYDVPVELGWLKEPIPEDLLNPIPMWM